MGDTWIPHGRGKPQKTEEQLWRFAYKKDEFGCGTWIHPGYLARRRSPNSSGLPSRVFVAAKTSLRASNPRHKASSCFASRNIRFFTKSS